jgi:Uncharacterized protein conserved in bacteria (DUF2059)
MLKLLGLAALGLCLGAAAVGTGGALAQTVPVTPQTATTTDQSDALFQALMLDDMMAVLRQEGVNYGVTLQADLFPDGGHGWTQQVSDIYDQTRIAAEFKAGLRQAIPADQLPDILAFFTSDLGQRVTRLEISARRALLDDALEQAADEMRDDLAAQHPPRLDQLLRFVEVNDLTEANVSSALNANLAFYQGMNAGGGFPEPLSEDDILRDVWAQEPSIRSDTDGWLMSFLGLAYQPLPDGDLDAYIAFSETPAGQALNRAQFAAFDALFADVSRRLGKAAAGHISGQDL